MNIPIYLDYNGTTPLDPEVIEVIKSNLKNNFGNPSSDHPFGRKAKDAVEYARNQVALLLNCKSGEIIFTSGGTESNNFTIKGIAFTNKEKGNHIITTQVEHPSVLEVTRYLEEKGFKITYLGVDGYGIVNGSDVEKAITPKTILISVMHANNEVGSIQPIKEISKIAKKNRIFFHTDAAQSAGKILTDTKELGVDLLSLAGHKMYAPKGIGALFIKSGAALAKYMHGASQEKNQRAGTENVLGIIGFGKACEIAKRDLLSSEAHLIKVRDKLFIDLKKKKIKIKINGHPDERLPNTLSLSFHDIDANQLIHKIKDNLAVSAGAACHSSDTEVSHVLKAMNVPLEWAKGTLRFSVGKMTTEDEIEKAVNIITDAIYTVCNGLCPATVYVPGTDAQMQRCQDGKELH